MEGLLPPFVIDYITNRVDKITLDKKPNWFRKFGAWSWGIAVDCYYDEEDFKRKLEPQVF